MNHAQMDELYELYVMGVLEAEAAAEIDTHIRDNCSYCLQRVGEALQNTTGLAWTADQVTPPKYLRDRVLAGVRPQRRFGGYRLAIAGLAAACMVLLAFSFWSNSRMQTMRDQLHSLLSERDELRAAIAILSRSDTRAVQFGLAENVPHGRVFVNRSRGVVFIGSLLPPLSSDKTFELWLVPAKGAPQPAGLFRPNASGESVNVISTPLGLRNVAAVAVSIEPRQGSSAPTTKPILVVPFG